jgi:hypothetical protein
MFAPLRVELKGILEKIVFFRSGLAMTFFFRSFLLQGGFVRKLDHFKNLDQDFSESKNLKKI